MRVRVCVHVRDEPLSLRSFTFSAVVCLFAVPLIGFMTLGEDGGVNLDVGGYLVMAGVGMFSTSHEATLVEVTGLTGRAA